MAELGVLHQEPRHKVEEFVREIVFRRQDTLRELYPELTRLITGLVDQFAVMKKHDPSLDLRSVKFERIRWSPEGVLLVDMFSNRRRFNPRDLRWD